MAAQIKTIHLKILFALLLAVGVMEANPANATDGIFCTVLTIEASNGSEGVDAALSQYAAIFSQQPFASFSSFKLINEKQYTLELNKPLKLTLPADLSGSLEYRGALKSELHLNLNISSGTGKPVLIEGTASNGVPFIAAGLKSPNGRWVIAVKCSR